MQMPEKDLEAFEKVVLAGMKVMFDKKTFGMFMNGLMKENVPLPKRLAMETAGLMKMLMDKSKGTIPVQIIAPAGAMLLMEMGKFMAEAGVGKPTGKDIKIATVMLMKILESMYAKPQGQAKRPPQATRPPQAMPPQPAQQQPATGLIGA